MKCCMWWQTTVWKCIMWTNHESVEQLAFTFFPDSVGPQPRSTVLWWRWDQFSGPHMNSISEFTTRRTLRESSLRSGVTPPKCENTLGDCVLSVKKLIRGHYFNQFQSWLLQTTSIALAFQHRPFWHVRRIWRFKPKLALCRACKSWLTHPKVFLLINFWGMKTGLLRQHGRIYSWIQRIVFV